MYVGRLDPEKRIEEIIQAVAVAVKTIDFYFVVVVKGVRKAALQKLANNLGIADKVIFTGFVPDEDLPYLYKLSHSFIIASIAELLSLVTLQAMASGLPVIAANAGALVELVQHNKNGYLFNPGDISAIVECINAMFMKDDLYEGMCEKSVEYSQYHDINVTVDSFERIYNRMLHTENKAIKTQALQELVTY